jgi:Fic family protein
LWLQEISHKLPQNVLQEHDACNALLVTNHIKIMYNIESWMTKKHAKIPAKKPAKKAAAPPPRDDGEDVARMEPMRISEECTDRSKLTDLVLELTKRSTAFRASLPSGLVEPLADFVRSMNCYYSNLIEGHNTHPVDIERALNNDISNNPKKRDLQLEAKAHIEVQRWIDEGGLGNREMTIEGICQIHRRFTELLPEALRWVENPDTGEKIPVVPGLTRTRDAKVGAHIAVSPGAVSRFLPRFEERYSKLGDFETILSVAPAHHRLLYIHPFADGNGRVTRLMSYATLLRTLDTAGLWSVARGLARRQTDYKRHLAECDVIRRGDRDGRGHLSEASLISFTRFFLEVCMDQVKFMERLMEPKSFRGRFLNWAEEETRLGTIPARGVHVLDAILFRGSLPRSEVQTTIGQSERAANYVTRALSKHGVIMAPGARADWQIAFPARLAPRLMPGLFPEQLALPDSL